MSSELDLFGKVVSVFGGSGFIGRYVVRHLAEAGATVEVVTRNPRRAGFLRPAGVVGQVVPVWYSPHDEASIAKALNNTDIAINLVGILAESRKDSFNAIHAELPGKIARLAAAEGIGQMVQISAIGADPGSNSAYARSKAAGESAVHDAMPKATILRPSIVFGPEDEFFNRFASMARFSPALPLIGGGKTRFQPVYVGDVADAVMAALARPDAAGGIFELGGPQVYTFRGLLEYMLSVTGQKAALVPLPFPVATLQGAVLENLPGKLLTRDQVTSLKSDNVVADDARTLSDLGIEATALEMIVPTYLSRFRSGSRFAEIHELRKGG